jgi:hypothetical protein
MAALSLMFDQEQTPTLTLTAWLGGQSNGMYAYNWIRRTVSARARYSAAVSGKSDTLRVRDHYAADCLRNQTQSLTFDLVFL